MRVIVCGTRKAKSKRQLFNYLLGLEQQDGEVWIAHGDCPNSPDQWSEEWVDSVSWTGRGLNETTKYPAEWDNYGKKAGFYRNQQMLDEHNPELVIAVWDGSSSGTRDMIVRAVRYMVPVHIIPAIIKRDE